MNNKVNFKIINELNETDKLILIELGKMKISVNKNVSRQTIMKKLPDSHVPNARKSIKKLKNKGLIIIYRKENYGVTKKGRIIAQTLVEQQNQELYSSLNKILVFFQ